MQQAPIDLKPISSQGAQSGSWLCLREMVEYTPTASRDISTNIRPLRPIL